MSEPIYNAEHERMTYVLNGRIQHAYKVYEDDEKTAWILEDDKVIWRVNDTTK